MPRCFKVDDFRTGSGGCLFVSVSFGGGVVRHSAISATATRLSAWQSISTCGTRDGPLTFALRLNHSGLSRESALIVAASMLGIRFDLPGAIRFDH